MKTFRGRLFEQSRSVMLRICSRSLTKSIAGEKISVKLEDGKLVLSKNSNGIRIGKSSDGSYIRLSLTSKIDSTIKLPMEISVTIKGFNLTNVVQNEVALRSPLYERSDIPEKIYWTKAYLNAGKKGIKVNMHRKALYNLANNSTIRVVFQKTKQGIILRKFLDATKGRKLYVAKRNRKTLSYVTEIAFPKELRSEFNGIIGIPIEEFGVSFSDFSNNEEELALLAELLKRRVKVFPASPHKDIGDLVLENGGYIEITKFNPAGRKDSRHNSSPMQVRGRIFEAEHNSIHRKISPIFVVLHSDWLNNRHLIQEAEEARKYKVFSLFTDFQNGWQKQIAKEIIEKLPV